MGILDLAARQIKFVRLDSDIQLDMTPRTVNTRAVIINKRWYVFRNLDPL